MYELFVALHVPAAIVFLAMMFWHCNNYLNSWDYLFATLAIWLAGYIYRLFHLNWTKPWRMSWLIGDQASVYLLSDNAIKVTIPTRVRWQPGQYVYLRMPGVSVFENHPFTVASLCSSDFPSEHDPELRDMVLVFRPFGGFTAKVLASAIRNGPWHEYRAFLDGPYGGVQRPLDAFDQVVLIAGGSGITALISHLLFLIKRMRDGKAATMCVHVIWVMKRPETMDWFREELRICRDSAPPGSVSCQFYITAAKRSAATGQLVNTAMPIRSMHAGFKEKVNDAFQDIANKRSSHISEVSNGRTSALIRDEAGGDVEKAQELRRENEDEITPLPKAHVVSHGVVDKSSNPLDVEAARPPTRREKLPPLSLDTTTSTLYPPHARAAQSNVQALSPPLLVPANIRRLSNTPHQYPPPPQIPKDAVQHTDRGDHFQSGPGSGIFDFGFPTTPTEFQKSLMRFAFLPASLHPGRRNTITKHNRKGGWSTEYGRPDMGYWLRQWAKREWTSGAGPTLTGGTRGMSRVLVELPCSFADLPG